MFCLSSRLKAAPANLDAIAKICREQVVPLITTQPGFKGFYLLTKPDGEFTILDIFDTEAQAMAWVKCPPHDAIVKQLGPLLAGPPAGDSFEVRAAAAKA